VNIKSQEYTVFFCGISKNCIETIKYNLSFLSEYEKKSKFQIEVIFVDSDSNDGTKTEIENFTSKNSFIRYLN